MRFATLVAASTAFAGAALADAPLDTSGDFVYAIDTCYSNAVRTASDLALFTSGARTTGWGVCDTVTLTDPDGTVVKLADNASAAGWADIPIDRGGRWTLSSPDYGTFTVMVRHSLYGTQGDGSRESPLMLVEDEEVVNLLSTALSGSDAYYFMFPDENFVTLPVAAGNGLEEHGAGLWRIFASSDGRLFTCADAAYMADSIRPGPNRKIHKDDVCEIAYSGDDWLLRGDGASTLTIRSPAGAETVHPFTGTGVSPVTFDLLGTWTASIVSEWGTRTAEIYVVASGFAVSIQ